MRSVAQWSEAHAGTGLGGKALEGLLKFMDERRHSGREYEGGFEAFEREVRQRFSEAERELVGEELARLDVSLPEIFMSGVRHRRVISGDGEYLTAAGPVRVLRHRYRAVGDERAERMPAGMACRNGGRFLHAAGGADGPMGGDASESERE